MRGLNETIPTSLSDTGQFFWFATLVKEQHFWELLNTHPMWFGLCLSWYPRQTRI